MSLLVSSKPDLSLAGKQARVANRVRMTSSSIFNQIAQTYQQLHSMVWTNPSGLTPQQVVQAVGTDAAQLFQLMTVLATAANAATPGSITAATPAGYGVQQNSDGTVTITVSN